MMYGICRGDCALADVACGLSSEVSIDGRSLGFQRSAEFLEKSGGYFSPNFSSTSRLLASTSGQLKYSECAHRKLYAVLRSNVIVCGGDPFGMWMSTTRPPP